MITVKYLASLAERLGKSEETLVVTEATTSAIPLTVAQAWSTLNPETPMPANTLCAIDFNYAEPTTTLPPHGELAFFPPVTGG